jgi:hypothetical protein
MNAEKHQLRANNSLCTAAFQLLRGRAPAQLRGNTPNSVCVTGGGGGCERGNGPFNVFSTYDFLFAFGY